MEITLTMKITIPSGVSPENIHTEIQPQFRFESRRQSSRPRSSRASPWLKSMPSISVLSKSRPASQTSSRSSTSSTSEIIFTPPASPSSKLHLPIARPVDQIKKRDQPYMKPIPTTFTPDDRRLDVQAVLHTQYRALKVYLGSTHPTRPGAAQSGSKRLDYLPLAQLFELSTDIRAELLRRQRVDVWEVQYQHVRRKEGEWPEHRLQVQQMLGVMDEESFRVLVVDLVKEVEWRFPGFVYF